MTKEQFHSLSIGDKIIINNYTYLIKCIDKDQELLEIGKILLNEFNSLYVTNSSCWYRYENIELLRNDDIIDTRKHLHYFG